MIFSPSPDFHRLVIVREPVGVDRVGPLDGNPIPEPSSRTPRQLQPRLHDPEVSEVLAHYQAGATVYELADRYGIHSHTVSEILERQGVARRYRMLSPEQLDLACTSIEMVSR